MQENNRGFTLIELMVVIAIMGILATMVVVVSGGARAESRDVDRQADLRIVATALESFKQKYGQYPAGCNGPTVGPNTIWSGQTGTAYRCSGNNNQYIVGLAPEFIPVLPQDSRLDGTNSGYVYTTNAAGTVYKFMAKNTVEAETVTIGHPFQSCDRTEMQTRTCQPALAGSVCYVGLCDQIYNTNRYSGGGNTPNECAPLSATLQFESSYAVWSGIADADPNVISANGRASEQYRVNVERLTEHIVCAI